MFAKQSSIWGDFFSAMMEIWDTLNTTNEFLSFIVCLNRKKLALVNDLLSYYSLVLQALDLIFFTTDLKNSKLLLNKSLPDLELIYFLTHAVSA